jgi:AraC-like DNA-binding protein
MGEERISFSRPAGMDGVQVLSASDSRRPWSMVHDTFTPTLVTRGTGKWRCRGVGGEIRPAQVLLISPGDLHRTLTIDEPGGSFWAFFVPPDYTRSLIDRDASTTDRFHFKAIATDDPVSVGAMTQLARALAGRADDSLSTSVLATTALRTLFERNATGHPPEPSVSTVQIARAVEVIRDAFACDPCTPGMTVELLRAAVDARSTTGLIHAFCREIGVPPHQYLLRLRVQRARRLIERGPNAEEGIATLTDVSVASGFYDLSHMGRVFRRVLGVAPSRYTRQIGVFWPGIALADAGREKHAIAFARASSS